MALYHFRSERNIQHLTMEEKFIASNVPKPTLLRHIRQLEMFLKIKVSTYALKIGLRTRQNIYEKSGNDHAAAVLFEKLSML